MILKEKASCISQVSQRLKSTGLKGLVESGLGRRVGEVWGGFGREWPSGLRLCDRIGRLPVQDQVS